ncbi:uncharacterized protein C3orf67 homolog [Nematolebias whitei]|uniref:uncharacterized protein C3orf67 homolog n=1 Tax=Nematolebias whitei TaxID=451745 RepID=UPI00189B0264|nr:uncharacterized protein C3orf67 homolog [Nematolebias whitei]
MFKNDYQGGAVFDIFSGQGKDPVAKWKLCGGTSAIHKEYNKEVKGFVYCLEGSSQTVKMQMPENAKMSLRLIQRYLVLQVNIPRSHDFSTELVITDSEHLKRRLHFSTLHKELSATLLHAKIPFTDLKCDTWSTLCIDLVSWTRKLFKGYVTLDGITLFATCKVRRIFTMKTDAGKMSHDDVFLDGATFVDMIPQSFRYPPDVHQIARMLSIENLQKAEMRSDPFISGSVPDQSPTAISTKDRRAKPQGVLHTASGSRASAPSPQTGSKSGTTKDRLERSGFPSSKMNMKITPQSQNISKMGENLSHGQRSHVPHEGAFFKLQPHPPQKGGFGKQGCKKLRVISAGKEKIPSSDVQRKTSVREKYTFPSSQQKSRPQPLTSTEKSEHRTPGERSCSPAKGSPGAIATPAESQLEPGLSSDLQVWNSWESNEESEPQLTLQEEVFTFSSPPHSPKRGQNQGDQEKMEMGDDQVQSNRRGRHHAQPEDDFIGSESDEDKRNNLFDYQKSRTSSPASPRPPDATQHEQTEHHPDSSKTNQASQKQLSSNTCMQLLSSGGAAPADMVPTRCLSPDRQDLKLRNHVSDRNSSVSLCTKLLQEVMLGDSKQHKEKEDVMLKTVYSSHYVQQLHGSSQMYEDDDEELRMLASLKREQEEEECRAVGLSASQIQQCDVSISLSSDDTSTWTHISMPANQGFHYQKEMNPLLQSNPREWMDVLSPPIMPPSQQRRSAYTQNNLERLVRGKDGLVKEEENEDEYLKLLYDPCLNCYFDPKTGKYYELT